MAVDTDEKYSWKIEIQPGAYRSCREENFVIFVVSSSIYYSYCS